MSEIFIVSSDKLYGYIIFGGELGIGGSGEIRTHDTVARMSA